MSFASWAIILYKFFLLRSLRTKNQAFVKAFDKQNKISELMALSKKSPSVISSQLFQQVYNNFSSYISRYPEGAPVKSDKIGLICDSMERSVDNYTLECSRNLEKYIPILASISSSAPFIGLLGTVLGITFSFREIAQKGSTSLSVVAPGISEALIATALGLFVAIPALIAYNSFRSSIRNVTTDTRIFGMRLINKLLKAIQWD